MNTDRRGFLTGMLAAGSAPLLFNGCATGFAACKRINIAAIGYGRIAHQMDVAGCLLYPDRCRVTAVCELDSNRAMYGKMVIEGSYAQRGIIQPVKTYGDYHEMLKDPSIDAVLICVPDHQHALVAAACLMAGKHIYLQKPFAQTIQEGRILANLAKQKGVVVQVGAWQRSVPEFRKAVQFVRNGRIGKVVRVEIGLGVDDPGGDRTPQPIPTNLNYDAWLGPTDGNAPYNETRVHNQDLSRIRKRPGWIQLAPYGWGMITNWGAHHLDIAAWALNADPKTVSGTCGWMDMSGTRLWNVHTTYDLHYEINGADMHVMDKYPTGLKFVGEKGDWIWCTRPPMKITPSDPDPVIDPNLPDALGASKKSLLADLAPSEIVDDALNRGEEPFLNKFDHIVNWLEAIKREDPSYTVSNAEEAHKSTAYCTLGHMCMEVGRGKKDGATLAWDAVREMTGNVEADGMLAPLARGKYDLKPLLTAGGYDYAKMLKPIA